ncbi:MAG: HypC/HybG/HupF family hydrogenase formation chaperone [SAR324 cluster bacterium]|nr:HypC/HybG/HupF family hydrogenase formation chaperone [SAR324 cluster bacterium]
MCLAIPGKVIEIDETIQPKMAKVNFDGIIKSVCIEWTPEVGLHDYVIVHAGFAINKLDEEEAMETLKIFAEMEASLQEEARSMIPS